ncbi:hypothetical protein SCAR479_04916 [Seiridium cardinale]|uniref:Uncharacterized protein n=1 Tax=Seiridium cardinale TaxID=138064 RepID=A0ABR2Y4P8_9PEZI
MNLEYLVDATGRAGIILKNCKYNTSPQLKSVATWGYWEGGAVYAKGTEREGSPYFETLPNASGWVWYIPLHTGKVSVGVVMNQDKCTAKKREAKLDGKGLYLEATRTTPGVSGLLQKANVVSDAPACASLYVPMADDSACFIDSYFSYSVHLALTGGMSAAITVAAPIRGNCDELQASSWHSKKVAESYTRFLLGKLSQGEVAKTVELCFHAFVPVLEAAKEALVKKLRDLGVEHLIDGEDYEKGLEELGGRILDLITLEIILSPEKIRIIHTIRARRMLRFEDLLNFDNFGTDITDGLSPNLVCGALGLVTPEHRKVFHADVLAKIFGEGKMNAQKQPTEQRLSPAIEVMEVEIEATPNTPVEVKTEELAAGSGDGRTQA